MTPRKMYDHYCDSLKAVERHRWDGTGLVRVFPIHAPTAWAFLSENDRALWTDMARRTRPKR